MKKKCDCKHTTIGDSCIHILPHPTEKDYKRYIIPALKEILELEEMGKLTD